MIDYSVESGFRPLAGIWLSKTGGILRQGRK